MGVSIHQRGVHTFPIGPTPSPESCTLHVVLQSSFVGFAPSPSTCQLTLQQSLTSLNLLWLIHAPVRIVNPVWPSPDPAHTRPTGVTALPSLVCPQSKLPCSPVGIVLHWWVRGPAILSPSPVLEGTVTFLDHPSPIPVLTVRCYHLAKPGTYTDIAHAWPSGEET